MEEVENGFDAIAEKLKTIYPNQEGLYYGTAIPYMLGGNDPLDGVEVYESSQGEPHWHYITYGFSDLSGEDEDEEENEDEEGIKESGFGFELTFRLKKTQEKPPVWPINFLQNLARYVFSSGNVFDSGHHMNCNGPVALEEDTKLTAMGFLMDSELGEMDTKWGHVKFLQVIAITHDEMEGIMCWDGNSFLREIEKRIPLCITDLNRDSFMKDKEFYEIWQRGVERDGSSTGVLYMENFQCKKKKEELWLCLGAGHVNTFATVLAARVGKNRKLYIQTQEEVFCFQQSEKLDFQKGHDCKTVFIKKESIDEIKEILKPHKGEYICKTDNIRCSIVPTSIKGQNGEVMEVIE